MNSRLYEGRVWHERRRPHTHRFSYSVFQAYLDLSELDEVFHGRWLWSTRRPALAWFRRSDHMGDSQVSLDRSVRDHVHDETGVRPEGPIRVLTHLRYFGYCMNPVSFYYCFDAAGESVDFVVAEVNNTPWGERHCYVLDSRDSRSGPWRFRFRKQFHVSPFMSMDHDYDWSFTKPGDELGITMRSYEAGEHVFTAGARYAARAMNPTQMARVLMRYPFMTGRVVAGIYWQAFKLWQKQTPFHPHPKHHRLSETQS